VTGGYVGVEMELSVLPNAPICHIIIACTSHHTPFGPTIDIVVWPSSLRLPSDARGRSIKYALYWGGVGFTSGAANMVAVI
jgi:hypothetical protein